MGMLLAWSIPVRANEPARAPKLQDLINKVKAQELQYANYELLITESYEQLRPEEVQPAMLLHMALNYRTQWRFIRQNGWGYSSQSRTGKWASGKAYDGHYVYAFDGKHTRVCDNGKARIYEGLKESLQTCRPHTLLLGTRRGSMSLADYLGQTEGGHQNRKKTVIVTVLGQEEIDGLQCVKVRIEHWGQAEEDPEHRIVWLAVERNFFPAKSYYGLGLAWEEDQVLEWNEIQPGLWIPKRMELVSNDWDAARQGLIVPSSRREFRLERIDLKPNYPLEFFQKVTLPDGTPFPAVAEKRAVD
jgi:hypothetical protein